MSMEERTLFVERGIVEVGRIILEYEGALYQVEVLACSV